MDRRKLTGARLAADIGLSATSISKIVTGQSRPRQVTFSRLIKRLCSNAEEEQMMVSTFTALSDKMANEPSGMIVPPPDDEVERVTRYLEVKSMSVAFRSDVESVIRQAGVSYKKDFRKDPYICDFLVTSGKHRMAIDCKYNVNRDWDRTVTAVKLFIENLSCDEVVIVVPYENELAEKARGPLKNVGGRLLPLGKLKAYLQ